MLDQDRREERSPYLDLADAISGYERDGLPTAEDGLRSMSAVYAAVVSAKNNGLWVDARPPVFGGDIKSLVLE